ncbi:MAG: DUF1207 domain-containing protein [Planctomycetaceae bacterium]|nr:DUF1207 domain-containing protein [Planctomycetaceae bacterium]
MHRSFDALDGYARGLASAVFAVMLALWPGRACLAIDPPIPAGPPESSEVDRIFSSGVVQLGSVPLSPVRDVVQPAQYAETCIGDWQLLPNGHLYSPYLAGEKEPRFAAQWLWEKDRGLIWETSLGGRFGLVRNGTPGPNGDGFQIDLEGAGQARVDPEEDSDLEAADFRAGLIGTWRRDCWRFKTGYYHISSHVGDEFLIDNPGFQRRNYVRDALLVGAMYDVTPDFQLYGEYAAALNHNGGAEVGELQLGAQFVTAGPTGPRGAPYAAINGHLREEFDYGGSVNIVAGWLWRGSQTGKVFRVGAMYYDGPSIQYSFFDRHETLTGLGMWLDF